MTIAITFGIAFIMGGIFGFFICAVVTMERIVSDMETIKKLKEGGNSNE